jgi:hypothetical protein
MSQVIQGLYIITNEIRWQINETSECLQVCNRLAKSQGYSASTEKYLCFTSGNIISAAATRHHHERSGLVAFLTLPTKLLYVTPCNTMSDVVQWQTETAIPTAVHWQYWVTGRPLCLSLFQFACCLMHFHLIALFFRRTSGRNLRICQESSTIFCIGERWWEIHFHAVF